MPGPAPFGRKPTLDGPRVRLRPVTRDDADALREAMADREVLMLTGMLAGADDPGPELSPAAAREWYGGLALDPTRLDLAVLERAGGQVLDEVLGEVVLNDWDERSGTVNLRTFLGPAGRDRGLGTEALGLLLDHAFATLGLHRVQLEVFSFNPRAVAVYAGLGFRLEGTRREVLRIDGGWHDAHLMALLDHQWRGRSGT